MLRFNKGLEMTLLNYHSQHLHRNEKIFEQKDEII